MSKSNISLIKMCQIIKRDMLTISHNVQIGHVGSSLSVIDLLTTLYFKILNIRTNDPFWEERDRFILSKGHAGAGLFTVLHHRGFFNKETLDTFCQDGGKLMVHPESNGLPGIDWGTGSLGHGLSVGVGMAYAAKLMNKQYKIYVLISDGEINEGTIWEAALFAGHHHLNNLVVILDRDGTQGLGNTKDIINMEPLEAKWKTFNFSTSVIDGHNIDQITKALTNISDSKPNIIIANTIIGKGVSFMEGDFRWHYYDPKPQHMQIALKEIDETLNFKRTKVKKTVSKTNL
ncbi:MAG: transketolase [Microgenomates group bacterium]|jgi:transketolase